MRLINLTPHDINIRREGDELVLAPYDAPLPRVTQLSRPRGEVAGIPIIKTVYGGIDNLPEPEAGVIFIVSSLVLEAACDRTDLVAPATGPGDGCIRSQGRIVAITRLRVRV